MNNDDLKQHHTFFTQPTLAVGQCIPGESDLRLDETAARARAGLLNVLSGITIFLLIMHPELDPVLYVAPYVIFDMLMAVLFGLTPLSPSGVLGTALTMKSKPVWRPIKPKRFAWTLGAIMGTTCLGFRLLDTPDSWMLAVLGMCFVLTWLEAVLGFCLGCWMYGKLFGCEACAWD
ncbi:DUF4395 domain-containing protein [Enterovibrio norvegicus]|uniref:DUF4395 domain-containing protein n=1 Tax=Enterovibrio norvegicus TaxID=188144 RepID=UPI003899CC56